MLSTTLRLPERVTQDASSVRPIAGSGVRGVPNQDIRRLQGPAGLAQVKTNHLQFCCWHVPQIAFGCLVQRYG